MDQGGCLLVGLSCTVGLQGRESLPRDTVQRSSSLQSRWLSAHQQTGFFAKSSGVIQIWSYKNVPGVLISVIGQRGLEMQSAT